MNVVTVNAYRTAWIEQHGVDSNPTTEIRLIVVRVLDDAFPANAGDVKSLDQPLDRVSERLTLASLRCPGPMRTRQVRSGLRWSRSPPRG